MTAEAIDTGLTEVEAAERLSRYGPNSITTARRQPLWRRVLGALREPLVLVLLAAAALTVATGDAANTAVILLVVLVNTAVAVWQEARADQAVDALSRLAAPVSRVRRNGGERIIPAAEVVPGDVVVLGEGDVVPADGRVITGIALRLDESALTGESVAVDKTEGTTAGDPERGAGAGAASGTTAAGRSEDTAALWAGTTVVHGRGLLLVSMTGDDSALGRIARMMQAAPGPTPLQRRMRQLSAVMASAAVALCLLVLVLGLLRGEPLEVMVLTAVTLAVAAVPESLPVVISLSLAMAARRMARRRAIARHLGAVETLGSITLLATDKTGTLTEGRMSVDTLSPAPGVSERELLRALVLCNDARLTEDGAHAGDPMEVALLLAARERGVTRTSAESEHPRVAEIPFNSVSKTMTTMHAGSGGGRVVVVKGAPEALLRDERLDDARRAVAEKEASRLASTGRRVLAVAEGTAVQGRLRLLGLVALYDPPREGAADTITACRRAGIRPVLVTGDHPGTASAIAAEVGIGLAPAVDLSTLPAGHVADVAEQAVLARATPGQKLEAVDAWHAAGEVVAMTGDGVNDGPALRRADIGVAMGDRGTEVARQAADLVLADDDLRTVVAAVEEGRRVYANLRRFLLYGLSGGAAEILVMLAGPGVGIALPLLPAQILWVNLLTHSLAGTALGAEPAEPGSMTRPPRNPSEGVLGGGLWWRIALVAAGIAALSLGTGVLVQGQDPVRRSCVLLVLGAGQLGVALGAAVRQSGTRTNSALPLTVLSAGVLLVAAVLFAPLQALLHTAPVPTWAWLAAGGTALAGSLTARLLTAHSRPKGRRP